MLSAELFGATQCCTIAADPIESAGREWAAEATCHHIILQRLPADVLTLTGQRAVNGLEELYDYWASKSIANISQGTAGHGPEELLDP